MCVCDSEGVAHRPINVYVCVYERVGGGLLTDLYIFAVLPSSSGSAISGDVVG